MNSTTLSTPHDLLAAVPFLVGYHPTDSLVVIAIKEGSIGMAMRVDFPSQDHAEIAARAVQLASYVRREKAEAAIVVGYLPAELFEVEESLTPYTHAIAEQGIEIKEAIEVRGARFRSILCADLNCCPPEGSLIPPIVDSRITAEQIALGRPLPFPSVLDMKESIAAMPRDRTLIAALKTIDLIDYEELGPSDVKLLQREGAQAINRLCETYDRDGMSTDRNLIALVLTRLNDLQVRDYAMGLTTPESAQILWAMWRWILRIAPKGYVAAVAVIFATASYERGEGALAQRALDRAFEDDQKYSMAKLLRRTFAAGWPPSSFTAMREELHPKICASLFAE
jgi:hypothetical protein